MVAVSLICLFIFRLCLVAYQYLYVLCPFLGGGGIFGPLAVPPVGVDSTFLCQYGKH